MKKRILVLDAFTNGHEAVLAFIQRQGWAETDCEIVFCGTHPNVFKHLTEGPAYAVVPIRNSIAGEVTEVTKHLALFRETGYDLRERDRLDLQINTSVKQPAVEVMLESKAQIVGLHPMFRPEMPFDGQTVVACPARLTAPDWKTWVVNMLTATRAQIKWSTPAEHDGYMTTVQVIPHLGNLTSALLITEVGVSVSESLAFTSPFYRVMFSLMGRLVSQSPDLYTSIVMENPETLTMLERRIVIEQCLVQMIREKDQAAFEELFAQANTHFGPDVTKEANELFMRIIGVLSTLYGKNSVTLEFSKAQSRPGLLERISRVFSQRQINLTGINSVALDAQRLQFTLSFEQSRASDEVRLALEEIEDWSDPKVKVLNY